MLCFLDAVAAFFSGYIQYITMEWGGGCMWWVRNGLVIHHQGRDGWSWEITHIQWMLYPHPFVWDFKMLWFLWYGSSIQSRLNIHLLTLAANGAAMGGGTACSVVGWCSAVDVMLLLPPCIMFICDASSPGVSTCSVTNGNHKPSNSCKMDLPWICARLVS